MSAADDLHAALGAYLREACERTATGVDAHWKSQLDAARLRIAELEAENALLVARLANANAETADAREQRDEVTHALTTTDYFPAAGPPSAGDTAESGP